MAALLYLISGICGIGSLVCLILVLIQMFQNEQVGLGVACIVLVFFCGIGALIAFIMGWLNASKWNIQNVMWAWTGCWVVGFLTQVLAFALAAGAAASQMPAM